MGKKNVVFTKDGVRVGVKHVQNENYVDATQSWVVKAWNLGSARDDEKAYVMAVPLVLPSGLPPQTPSGLPPQTPDGLGPCRRQLTLDARSSPCQKNKEKVENASRRVSARVAPQGALTGTRYAPCSTAGGRGEGGKRETGGEVGTSILSRAYQQFLCLLDTCSMRDPTRPHWESPCALLSNHTHTYTHARVASSSSPNSPIRVRQNYTVYADKTAPHCPLISPKQRQNAMTESLYTTSQLVATRQNK